MYDFKLGFFLVHGNDAPIVLCGAYFSETNYVLQTTPSLLNRSKYPFLTIKIKKQKL